LSTNKEKGKLKRKNNEQQHDFINYHVCYYCQLTASIQRFYTDRQFSSIDACFICSTNHMVGNNDYTKRTQILNN